MATDQYFSRRHNLRRSVPITIRDEAPPELRNFVLQLVKHFDTNPHTAITGVYTSLGQIPPDLSKDRYADKWGWIRDAINSALWYKIYDLVERFYVRNKSRLPMSDYPDLLNTFFEEKGYSYRLAKDGKLEYRGEESFELAIGTANIALGDANLLTAQSEIHKALEDLAKRPDADLTGAVQHAMAGLECAAKEIAKEPKLELGKVLKKNPDMFPPHWAMFCSSFMATLQIMAVT